jgi:hypothetical protein
MDSVEHKAVERQGETGFVAAIRRASSLVSKLGRRIVGRGDTATMAALEMNAA